MFGVPQDPIKPDSVKGLLLLNIVLTDLFFIHSDIDIANSGDYVSFCLKMSWSP